MTETSQEGGGSRRTVASYSSYADAERAVDYLSDRGFEVSRTAIVGRDLRYVEQITGPMTYGKAALRGALTGAFVGVLIGSASSTGSTPSSPRSGLRSTDSGSARSSARSRACSPTR
jgi:hypothetical protein